MLLGRSDRGLLAQWWFTVDRGLMFAVLLLMASGVLVSMAASPPVAERIGADTFHFIKGQLFYLVLAVPVLVALSFFPPRHGAARRASRVLRLSLGLMVAALFFGPEIKGAHRWIDVGPIKLQPSEFAKPAFVIVAAWFLAEHTRRPEMPGHVIAFLMAAPVHRPSRHAARLRADGARDPHLRLHAADLWHLVVLGAGPAVRSASPGVFAGL